MLSLGLSMAVGCGGGDGADSPKIGSITIPATGGTVSGPNGTVSVRAPAGAVSVDLPIDISRATGVPSDPTLLLGSLYTFTSTTFTYPVGIIIHYDPSQIPAGKSESQVTLVKLVNNVWQPLPSLVDPISHTVRGLIGSFSTYGVAAGKPLITAEATLDSSGSPAVRVTSVAQEFVFANNSAVQWQFERNSDAIQ